MERNPYEKTNQKITKKSTRALIQYNDAILPV